MQEGALGPFEAGGQGGRVSETDAWSRAGEERRDLEPGACYKLGARLTDGVEGAQRCLDLPRWATAGGAAQQRAQHQGLLDYERRPHRSTPTAVEVRRPRRQACPSGAPSAEECPQRRIRAVVPCLQEACYVDCVDALEKLEDPRSQWTACSDS